jgi:prolyl-tRNA synthetase
MRLSRYFLKTSKTVSSDETIASARLLKQGGFIHESVAGRYYFLPIGQRVQQRVMSIIKEEMDAADAQEMVAPILHPLELWKETNRTNTAGFELMNVTDRRGAQFALGGTAEEMFVDLVRGFQLSYRDLPFQLYQFSPKFRDELRARGGLLRVREFIMKDGYSFHADAADFKIEYEKMKTVYTRIFDRLGLPTIIVESDNGYIGGEYCHEFVVESEIGESTFFVNETGDYAAHEDVAVFQKEKKNAGEDMQPLTPVDAVRGTTMEDGVTLHALPLWQQIKDVLFVDERGRFILAIIRGDFDVNETKLNHVAGTRELRPATDEEIRDQLHSEPGFLSPVGIKENREPGVELVIVADDSLRTVANCYGGNNAVHKDLFNINIDRDYQPDIEGDIALAQAGYPAVGGGTLLEKRGIEVGNIFQLGYHYTKLMQGAVFNDADGKDQPFYMGCYGIGVGRTMAAIIERHHDDRGMIWPAAVAPFQVQLIALNGVETEADELYAQLTQAGITVLYDDRDKQAGEKFADADLIGLPWRIVVSKKTIAQNSVEVKRREDNEARLVTNDQVLSTLQ